MIITSIRDKSGLHTRITSGFRWDRADVGAFWWRLYGGTLPPHAPHLKRISEAALSEWSRRGSISLDTIPASILPPNVLCVSH